MFEYLHKRRNEIDHRVLAGHQSDSGQGPVLLDSGERSVHMYVAGISGTGKSRFLENLILQDICKGHPLCLIDPMGDLYHRVLEFIASCIEQASGSEFSVADILPEYLFLDATGDTPIRINPLEPNEVETPEQQVDDLMQAVERLLGALEERVRLRNILRGAFRVTAELNRLPEKDRPELPSKYRKGNAYPLNLFFAVDFLDMSDQERATLLRALPETDSLRFRRQYAEFFASNPSSEQARLIQSSMNVFQYLLDDELVLRVTNTRESTVQFYDLLRTGKSLLCHLPIGENLMGVPFLGRLITTKLQRAAYRRPQPEWGNPYYLYLDEFQFFSDQGLANAMTNLRKFGLRLINAHQSLSQPPFDTPQGRALLETIKANSQIKVAFRLHRPDAEVLARDFFALSQQRLSHIAEDVSTGVSEAKALDLVFGFSVTNGTSRSWSRSESMSLAQTQTYGIGRTHGTNIGRTLSNSHGGSVARSLSDAISVSESQGITEAHSRNHQMSVAVGENWSQVRDHRRGLTFTQGINESLAQLEGQDYSHSSSLQNGQTHTHSKNSQEASGGSSQRTHGDHRTETEGVQLLHSDDGGVTFYDPGNHHSSIARSSGTGKGNSQSIAEIRNSSMSKGESHARAISQIRGVSSGFTEKQASTRTSGSRMDHGRSESEGLSVGSGGSHTHTTGHGSGWSWGRSSDQGLSTTATQGETETNNWQSSLAEAFTLLEQFTQSLSEALQRSRSTSVSMGLTESRGFSRSQQIRQGRSQTETVTRTYRQVHHTMEGERELYINQLQRLENRRCFLSSDPLRPVLLETPFVPDRHYDYLVHDLPKALLELQAARLAPKKPSSGTDHGSPPPSPQKPTSAEILRFPVPDPPDPPEVDEDDPFLD